MKQKKNKKRKVLPKPAKKGTSLSFSSVLGMLIGLALLTLGLYFGIMKHQPGGYFIAVIGFCFFAMVLIVYYWRTKKLY